MASEDEEPKNKPEDSDFKQQRLKAWQPILTPPWVIFTFASVGVLFLGLGIAVLMASNEVVEISSKPYEGLTVGAGNKCTSDGVNTTATSCLVDVPVEIPQDMKAPIYVYYHLSNFYQNHRRYVKSRNDVQLRGGDYFSTDSCDPLATRACGTGGTCAVYPCGLIAWSVFNDTFYSKDGNLNTSFVTVTPASAPGTTVQVPWTSSSIAWASDKEKKFKLGSDTPVTPGTLPSGTCTASTCVTLPYDSYKYYKCTDLTVPLSQCPQNKRYADVGNEEFIVWMRTSGLPTFRKLHRIINQDLKKGDKVHFYVNNVFPVTAFKGTKKIVLSTTTWIGGKNAFLGWMYIIVAVLCILLAIAFAIKQAMNPREPTAELDNSLRENTQ